MMELFWKGLYYLWAIPMLLLYLAIFGVIVIGLYNALRAILRGDFDWKPLKRQLLIWTVFVAGLYVADHAAHSSSLAGLLTLGFALLAPFGLDAFLDQVERDRESTRQMLESEKQRAVEAAAVPPKPSPVDDTDQAWLTRPLGKGPDAEK